MSKKVAYNWHFETTRFAVKLFWSEATASFVEHQNESAESTITDIWQYIAEYSNLPNILEDQRLYLQLNNQILGCPYSLTDTLNGYFTLLPDSLLPLTRPSELQVASLYQPNGLASGGNGHADIMLMVGMENRQENYWVSLIVEHWRERKKWAKYNFVVIAMKLQNFFWPKRSFLIININVNKNLVINI